MQPPSSARPEPQIYLNAASYGPLPRRSKDAIDVFNARRMAASLTDEDLQTPLAAARAAAALLIGADASEIALTPNTSVGINIAATAAFQLGDDRRVIIVSDREFPANMYPWLALARQDFAIEIVPPDSRGMPDEAAMLERIDHGDVAAVSISFVQFASGYRADTAAIGAACRRHDTLFVVDAIQGLGAVPLDVRAHDIDILACGGQKWLCAPWSTGFAYVRRDLITKFEPLLPGWLSFQSTQDFTHLTDYAYDLLDDARRFETGSLGFQDFVGFHHSVELLLERRVESVWQHIQNLQDPILEWADARGVAVVSDTTPQRRSGILCIRPPNAASLYERLNQAGVRCALRESAIRLSPHWYNTEEEIDRLLKLLESNLDQ